MSPSGRIRDLDIEEVRERTDIVQLISEYVPLKKSGREFRGPCPFHAEKDPSFYVNPAKGVYFCFGCKASGGVFNFLMQIEGLSFNEAVEKLADRIGYRLTYESLTPEEEKARSEKDRLFDLLKTAAEYYSHILRESEEGKQALNYLESRKISPEIIKDFMLGFAPAGWSNLSEFLLKKGYREKEIITAGLARPRSRITGGESGIYDIFRKRIIFPIFDHRGRVIAFGGRRLDESASHEEPKYINSPETPIYQKSRVLYGFYQARKSIQGKGEVIIVEGYTDLLALYRAGITWAVATLGTALTEYHFSLLGKFCDRVYLAFDADRAGNEAARRPVDFWERFRIETFVVSLPEGEDPASMIESGRVDDFLELLGRAEDLFEFAARLAVNRFDTRTAMGRTKAMEACIPLFLKLSSDDLKPLRDDLIRKLSGWLDMPVETVKIFSRRALKARRSPVNSGHVAAISIPSSRIEREALRVLLHDPRALLEHSYLDADYFEDEINKKIVTMLKEILFFGEEEIIAGYEKAVSRMLDSLEEGELKHRIARLIIESPPPDEDGSRDKVFERLSYLFFKRMKRRIESELEKVDKKLEPKKYEALCDRLIEIDQVIKEQFPYEHN